MKLLTTLSILFFLVSACSPGSEQHAEQEMEDSMEMTDSDSMQMTESDTEGEEEVLSPPRETSGEIGGTLVTVNYSAPSVRGRVIWNDLVPYDNLWVTGAHMATSVEFAEDMVVAGTPVPAGKYAFFTIPSEEGWTVILNGNWDQHQADDYDESLDVARFTVEPSETEFTEQLIYNVVSESDNTGAIEMMWEELKISVPLETP
jgi:hypothetical protein